MKNLKKKITFKKISHLNTIDLTQNLMFKGNTVNLFVNIN